MLAEIFSIVISQFIVKLLMEFMVVFLLLINLIIILAILMFSLADFRPFYRLVYIMLAHLQIQIVLILPTIHPSFLSPLHFIFLPLTNLPNQVFFLQIKIFTPNFMTVNENVILLMLFREDVRSMFLILYFHLIVKLFLLLFLFQVLHFLMQVNFLLSNYRFK